MVQFREQFRTIEHYWDSPEWLGRRMLFLSGPRQVGKTTLVTSAFCANKEAYFNWDNPKVRRSYQTDPDFIANIHSPWICFDEIHKRPRWKDILKGIYDTYKNNFQFVIMGSARLETFQKSGDSLVGRYFHTHLFPLNIGDFEKTNFTLPTKADELLAAAADQRSESSSLDTLLHYGGFPEPFFATSETFWKRWARGHHELILREDLRDLTKVTEIDKIETLLHLLQPSIGSLISYRNMAQDLETTHGSVRRWLEMLHKLHLIFPVSPYAKNIRRAYKKEKKWYYMDWRFAEEKKFENYIAASLLRASTLYTDRYGDTMSLYFLRTHDQTEVDFLLCRNGKPWLLIEAKEGSPDIPSAVYRFTDELKVPCAIVTRKENIVRMKKTDHGQNIYLLSWSKLGAVLP